MQGVGSDVEEDDGADDLAVVGHETRHVLAEVFHQICSEEEKAEASSAGKWKAQVDSLTSELRTGWHNELFLKLQVHSIRTDLEKVKSEASEVWKVKKLANAKNEAAGEAMAKLQAEELGNESGRPNLQV
ncbi:hypothetical protein R1sor_010523 [Riccia sorocarpa]|uniref:Uncharacterized protein n=1 Tax=Riccia sorocarpa TaxID=122646 RepID=A0ABD3I1Z8_9MARC